MLATPTAVFTFPELRLLQSTLLHFLLPKCHELQEIHQCRVSDTHLELALLNPVSLCVGTLKPGSFELSDTVPQKKLGEASKIQ